MSNLVEAQNLVAELRKSERIPADGVALVQIVLSLAEACDSDPQNASLWREYRQAEQALRELTGPEETEFDALVAALRNPAVGPADSRSQAGGSG